MKQPTMISMMMRLLICIIITIPVISYRYEDFFPPEEEEYDPFKFDPK
jgi:hypothetical protein